MKKSKYSSFGNIKEKSIKERKSIKEILKPFQGGY